MIAAPQSSVPHPCDFFLSQGWEATIAGYSISGSGLIKRFGVFAVAVESGLGPWIPSGTRKREANVASRQTHALSVWSFSAAQFATVYTNRHFGRRPSDYFRNLYGRPELVHDLSPSRVVDGASSQKDAAHSLRFATAALDRLTPLANATG